MCHTSCNWIGAELSGGTVTVLREAWLSFNVLHSILYTVESTLHSLTAFLHNPVSQEVTDDLASNAPVRSPYSTASE